MKRIFRRKKKSASEAGSIGSGLSGSAYNVSPKKDLGKLHRAAFEGDLTKLKTLLKRGDVNQLDKENRTALHLACSSGKFETVRMLCDHPNIKLNLCDNERRSALMKCVQCEHLTCLKILLDKEADVSLCDINGNTALHIASSIPNSDICYLLTDYNADPRAKNKDGATALHIAASLGSDEIVKLLLGLGVSVDDMDDNQKTALMNAAQKGHLTTVKLLLSKNANSALRDLNGWTADDYASMDGYHPISHVILEHNSRKGMPSAASRQSTLSKTPQTTPQKLGLQSGAVAIGGPAIDSEDESQSDNSLSASRATDGKESWASSQSDDEEPKYAKVDKKKSEAKPKINILQALNLRKKKNPDVTSPTPSDTAATSSPLAHALQSPTKSTTSLFLTTSAREQLEKQELEEDLKSDDFQEHDTRSRYDSKSARGLPVSSTKPPLPKPRSNQSLDEMDAPGPKYVPSKPTDDDSPWDSSEDESDNQPQLTTPAMKVSDQMSGSRPNERLMHQLGFDDTEMKNIYNEDESKTEHSHSQAPPAITTSTLKTKDTRTRKKSDSWDDSSSEKTASGEKKGLRKLDGAFNFLQGSSALKFDDETESEADIAQPPETTAIKPNQLIRDHDDEEESDDSSSWNSDDLVKRPEDVQTKQKYISSPSNVFSKDAEKMVSPKRKPGLQQKIEKREQKEGLGVSYGDRLSGEDSESEVESESSWEQENRVKKQQALNNKKDVEKDRKRMEEEEQKIREEELREEKERKKKQQDEEEERRELEENRKRDLEELEKLNRMNEELERKNAELRSKAQEEEKRKREEEEKVKNEATKASLMNESLRVALERAADAASDSGDSGPESIEHVKRTKEEEKSIVKTDYPADSSTPVPTFELTTRHKAMNQVDLDTLIEETETEDDSSLSESHLPVLRHASPLSDSLKLTEEKQSLSLQLVKEQDVSATAQEKLEKIQKENKQIKLKERVLDEEKKTWELEKVDFNAENRKLSFDVKNLEENLETVNLKLSKQDERSKRMEEQLQVERKEKREQEVLIRDLRIELKNANAATKQAELECEELRKTFATERKTQTLAQTMNEDSFKLNETLQNEALKDDKVESLEQVIMEKNQELIKAKAERDRYEDTSARYKAELSKLRSQDTDQHGNLVQVNQELNERLDEKEVELGESEEALQLTALQSVQFKRAYENCARQLAEDKREKENVAKDFEMLNNQQTQLKRDLEDSRSSYLREQERTRKLENLQEKMREKEADFQGKLLSAETKASRLENELQIAQSSNKQRAEDTAKWENESEKLREALKESEKNVSKLQRELAEQSGKFEALKIELHQRESECVQTRQEKEDLRSRNLVTATEQQDKFNTKLAALQREHGDQRVAFETRNVQLTQQIEHWKLEIARIERDRAHKDEELAQAQQDRIETHKKLGYADAFSKSASKGQKQLMEDNTKAKEDNIRLQSRVSLLEQKVEEKSSTIVDLQKEVDRFYQTAANANRKIDSLGESQRLTENSRTKVGQQLKDIELENIRLKSELESANSWKERLQESREEEAHVQATLEEKFSRLECDKVLMEEKLAAEAANLKILRSEADGHKSMWEAEVKSRSKLEVELSKAENEVEDERNQAGLLRNKLTKVTGERKTYKTKYEQLKREKVEAERRAESYSGDEIKRAQFENEKLREELKQLRAHVQDSYVDKSELEAARQNERIKAQAAIAPTLDQVNSFLKNQQLKYEFIDQVREKREESTVMGAMMRIAALEEQLKTERRRNENAGLRRFHQEEAEVSQHFESTKRENEILKQQLSRATGKAEEYKGYWVKERKKFQNFFSNTLGGSLVPNGTDTANLSATNGLPFTPSKLGGAFSSSLGGVFSSTPKKDTSDPLLAQLRSKLDATIAQHLSGTRDSSPHSASNINGQFSPRSSVGTPRSDGSLHPRDIATTSGHKPSQNEYMSFLLT